MIKVNIQQAKTHLSRYIEQVEQGDVIVACRHNKPVAELRSIETPPARPARVAGLLKSKVHWDAHAFEPMTAVWEISRKYNLGGISLPFDRSFHLDSSRSSILGHRKLTANRNRRSGR
ncbi:MAG: type II toxin-antitoxin system Phd/YefM family antitoxin [Bryobacteraceae bacterium]